MHGFALHFQINDILTDIRLKISFLRSKTVSFFQVQTQCIKNGSTNKMRGLIKKKLLLKPCKMVHPRDIKRIRR